MAYRGHWFYEALREIPTIADRTALTYWYVLKDGVTEDGIDLDTMTRIVETDRQPTRVQRMLATFMRNYPSFETEELKELTTRYIPDPAPKDKELPSVDDYMAMYEEALAVLEGKKKTGLHKAYLVWTVLHLAFMNAPLRVGELASIEVDNPEADNWLNTETDVITISKHKNFKTQGVRELPVKGFSEEWARHARIVFGTIPPYLIVSRKEVPYKASDLSTTLRRIGISSQTLRPTITTAEVPESTYEERQELARRMGHTMGTQMTKYYRGKYTN